MASTGAPTPSTTFSEERLKVFYVASKSSLFPNPVFFGDINKPFYDLFKYSCDSRVELKLSSSAVKSEFVGKKEDESVLLAVRLSKSISTKGKRGFVDLSGSVDSEGTAKASFKTSDKGLENLKVFGSLEASLAQKGNLSSANIKSKVTSKPSIPWHLRLDSSYYWRTYGIGVGLKYALKYKDSLQTSVDFNLAYVPSASSASTAARATASAAGEPEDRTGSWSFGLNSSIALGSSVAIRSKEIKKLQAVASYRAQNYLSSFYVSSETGDDFRTGFKYQQEVSWWNKGKFGVTAEHVRKLDSSFVNIAGAITYNFDPPSANGSKSQASNVSNGQLRGVINSSGIVFFGYSASLGEHTNIKLGAKLNLKNLQSPKYNQFGCTLSFKDN